MRTLLAAAVLAALSLSAAGCNRGGQPTEEAKIKANLDKLSAEDRKSAEAQKYCAVESKNALGSMGTPVPVTVEGQKVFLCCNGCRKKALAHPDKTLAKVKELRTKYAPAPPQ